MFIVMWGITSVEPEEQPRTIGSEGQEKLTGFSPYFAWPIPSSFLPWMFYFAPSFHKGCIADPKLCKHGLLKYEGRNTGEHVSHIRCQVSCVNQPSLVKFSFHSCCFHERQFLTFSCESSGTKSLAGMCIYVTRALNLLEFSGIKLAKLWTELAYPHLILWLFANLFYCGDCSVQWG